MIQGILAKPVILHSIKAGQTTHENAIVVIPSGSYIRITADDWQPGVRNADIEEAIDLLNETVR